MSANPTTSLKNPTVIGLITPTVALTIVLAPQVVQPTRTNVGVTTRASMPASAA